jgi:HPr kinase/phosphorylase
MPTTLIHGTCIASAGRAVLIRGPSGSGKSDLALRCLATSPSLLLPDSIQLVADDQVVVENKDGRLVARAPASIAGKIEVRGIGIVSVPTVPEAEIVIVVDLLPAGQWPQRFPDPPKKTAIAGFSVSLIELNPSDVSAVIKVLIALQSTTSVVK